MEPDSSIRKEYRHILEQF